MPRSEWRWPLRSRPASARIKPFAIANSPVHFRSAEYASMRAHAIRIGVINDDIINAP